GREGAGGELAELVATDAAHVLHPHQVFIAAIGQVRCLCRSGQGHHRVPVGSGVNAGGGGCVGGGSCSQVDALAGFSCHLGGIGKAVAAHPHFVTGRRQVGNEEPALVIGDDDFREAGGEVGGFGDDPDAGFGAGGGADQT